MDSSIVEAPRTPALDWKEFFGEYGTKLLINNNNNNDAVK